MSTSFFNGSSARRFLIAAASLLLALVGGTATAQSAPAYPTGTGTTPCAPMALSSYFATYGSNPDGNGVYTGCTVGIATFYNFNNVDQEGLDPAGILVTPNLVSVPFGSFNLNVPTFSFSALDGSPIVNNTDRAVGLTFEYYIDPPIDILGLGLADAPFTSEDTSVSVDFCANNTFAAQSETETPICAPGGDLTIFGGEAPQRADSTTFDPGVRFLDVQTLIVIQPHDSVLFSQTVPAQRPSDVVPEPDQLALGGIGGLALFGALRTRRRAKGQRA